MWRRDEQCWRLSKGKVFCWKSCLSVNKAVRPSNKLGDHRKNLSIDVLNQVVLVINMGILICWRWIWVFALVVGDECKK